MEAAIKAIAEPRRREILRLVTPAEMSAGEIAAHFSVTRPAISQHLTVLKEAGLIKERRQGTRRLYRIRPEGLEPLRAFIESFWGERLELLKEEAEHEAGRNSFMAHDEQDAVVSEVRIAAPPETIYPFLTDPDRIVRWMGRETAGEPRPGGALRIAINDWAVARGNFVELVPNQRVSFTFGWEGDGQAVPPGSSTVEISLTPDGDGTLVRLVHRDLPVETHPDHIHGWNHYLARLATLASGGDPGPDPNATATAPASATAR